MGRTEPQQQCRTVNFGATCLSPERAKDCRGQQISIGQTVRFTTGSGNEGGGPVVAIAGDLVVFLGDPEVPTYLAAVVDQVEIIPDYYSLIQLTSRQPNGRRS